MQMTEEQFGRLMQAMAAAAGGGEGTGSKVGVKEHMDGNTG